MLLQDGTTAKKPERVYLVALRTVEWFQPAALGALGPDNKLRIHVRKTHQFGPVALVEGRVFGAGESPLAKARTWLFAE
jgi:hypothetical protein